MKRNSSVELLRCLMMWLIVVYHSYVYGVFGGVRAWWTMLFTTIICWHVDTFLSISGWFGIEFSWLKIAKLIGLILFYNGLSWVCGEANIGGGWFGNNYLLLMVLAPGINRCVEHLVRSNRIVALWVVCGVLTLGTILYWLPWPGKDPMWWLMGGYSIGNFIFIYVVVRIVRLWYIPRIETVPAKHLLLVAVGFFGGMFAVFGGIELVYRMSGYGHLSGIGAVFSSYDAPHVWIMAIAVLLFFVWYVRVPKWMEGVARFIAPSMFGIYLLHDTTSFGHEIFRRPESWLAANTNLHPAVIIAIAACLTYTFCLGVDLTRRVLVVVLSRVVVAFDGRNAS